MLRAALRVGYHLLDRGVGAAASVEQSIRVLERSGLFNAGTGARLQLDGVRRMDASIMDGHDLRAGAVASVEDIVHPITAARLVMDHTRHVLLTGPPATNFFRSCGLERQGRSGRLPIDLMARARRSGKRRRQSALGRTNDRRTQETVGAVALDRAGNVAAGASTGGIDVMLPGRVGDTPLIGCGVYADREAGAVSMTGIGEGIIRMAMAKAICDRLERGDGPAGAARRILANLVARIGGEAGALTLTPIGTWAIAHVTPRMAAGWWDGKGRPTVGDDFR